MAGTAPKSTGMHLAGLALSILLAAACVGVYVFAPVLVRGTFLQRIENIIVILGIFALLTVAERLWVLVTARFHGHPPQ